MEDATVESGVPFSIQRLYSSSGAFKLTKQQEEKIAEKSKSWRFEDGWVFFPHIKLILRALTPDSIFEACLAEPNGNKILYYYRHRSKDDWRVLTPNQKACASSSLSAKNNPSNNVLRIDFKIKEAVLLLPNGGKRFYTGLAKKNQFPREFRLFKEELPSKHQIFYYYDKDDLSKIEITNPKSKKISWISFQKVREDPLFIKVDTSEGQHLKYFSIFHEGRNYLKRVEGNCLQEQELSYSPSRKGLGARVQSLSIEKNIVFSVQYYQPPNLYLERRWFKHPEEKDFSTDKVATVQRPSGEKGAQHTVARFFYQPNLTEVRDSDNLLIRFHHDSKRLLKVEYFDKTDSLRSFQKFYWNKSDRLRCKAFFDGSGNPIFARTFTYDELGNVLEEFLWGNLTGNPISPLRLDTEGNPSGAESYRKTYCYNPIFNTISEEREESGLTYKYRYVKDTNLLQSKFTCEKDKVLIREFYFYDENLFLSHEITDNGFAENPEDLSGVTKRTKKNYIIDPFTGLVSSIYNWYWDFSTGKEKLSDMVVISRKILPQLPGKEFSYLPKKKIQKQTFYDEKGCLKFSTQTIFDSYGRLVYGENPLGQPSIYRYNYLNKPTYIKEPGEPEISYVYDELGREISSFRNENTLSRTLYDTKNRETAQMDEFGNWFYHAYDEFGNKKQSILPEIITTEGTKKVFLNFSHDLEGNLTSFQGSKRSYNLFRNPIKITNTDGSEILHFYDKTGNLLKTCFPDGSEEHYTYDLFHRRTSKSVYESDKKKLSEERWVFDAFQLLSYTDEQGTTTQFFYDGSGRKIREKIGKKQTLFSYDRFGFLEKTENPFFSLIKIHNAIGLPIEEWQEDPHGRKENHMRYFYDGENRKSKVVRSTSQQDAIDLLEYDEKNRLVKHQDPIHNITEWKYETFINNLQQKVLKKVTISANGVQKIELYDANNRLNQTQQVSKEGTTLSQEDYLYDVKGNLERRDIYVFLDGNIKNQITYLWEYDCMGRIIKEKEDFSKTTLFSYDQKSRLIRKELPSGVILYFSYDAKDRLLEIKSSDFSIHYEYFYEKGKKPIKAFDHLRNLCFFRDYDELGNTIREFNSAEISLNWSHDSLGRVTELVLPDNSSIKYEYRGLHLNSVQRFSKNLQLQYEHIYDAFDANGNIQREQLIHNLGSSETFRDILERPLEKNSHFCKQSLSYYPETGLVKEYTNSLFTTKTYSYDALNQLSKEDQLLYNFDSAGNPSEHKIGKCNQILQNKTENFFYDLNGNLIEKANKETKICYEYDPLGRLISVIFPFEKKIDFVYDPFFRLFSKKISLFFGDSWKEEDECYYLYDLEKEIGLIDRRGYIKELKVLGLGLEEEVGAAISLEIDENIYLPIHDFQGTLIALIDLNGKVIESYQFDSFGRIQKGQKKPLTPWTFLSKRLEGELFFFGKRFYDPKLGRWISPDPAGCIETVNLYLFSRNDPVNRLDLIGLFSEPTFYRPQFYLDIEQIPTTPGLKLLQGKCLIDGVETDWVGLYSSWFKLKFSEEELKIGKIDILNHVGEMTPSSGSSISMILVQNGIQNSLEDFKKMNLSVMNKIPEGTFCMGLYNPSEGFVKDIFRTYKEKMHVETPIISRTRQWIAACVESLQKHNPEAMILCIPHSEAGVIFKRSMEKMSANLQDTLKKALLIEAVAPAEPIPKKFGLEVYNTYSEYDGITGGMAKPFLDDPNYNISFIKSQLAPLSDRQFSAPMCASILIWDHVFLGKTYSKYLDFQIKYLRSQRGFCHAQSNP